MSLKETLHHFQKIKDWVDEAKKLDRTGIERCILATAPSINITDLESGEFFKAVGELDCVTTWFEKQERPWIDHLSKKMDRSSPYADIKRLRNLFGSCLLSYEDRGDHMLTPIFNDTPKAGHPRFHSLGNAALYHDYPVSVFERPVKKELLYNGAEALEKGWRNASVVGAASSYKIVVKDGELLHPPKHPSDIKDKSPEDELSPGF